MTLAVAALVLAASPLSWLVDVLCPPVEPPSAEYAEAGDLSGEPDCDPAPIQWVRNATRAVVPPQDPVFRWLEEEAWEQRYREHWAEVGWLEAWADGWPDQGCLTVPLLPLPVRPRSTPLR